MRLSSANKPVERAQAWLGTRVSIRVDGCARDATDSLATHAAISAAFDEIARIHALMSFHESQSEVSLLNREAAYRAVPVDACTGEVVRCALQMSIDSDGVFDICIGGALVANGLLPAPPGSALPDESASYHDICIEDDVVSFARPLWIDLGGIAKGYAADRAIAILRAHGVTQAQVNAGGDIATLGDGPHRIALDAGTTEVGQLAVIEIGEGAVASSSNRHEVRVRNEQTATAHRDARRRIALDAPRSVSVLATRCMLADALTKAVMAHGQDSASLLAQYGASAYLRDDASGWQRVGSA